MVGLVVIYKKVLGFIVVLFGTTMVLSVLLQIAVRYLPITIIWTEELARLTFLWFAYTGSVLALTKDMHLAIDYFHGKLNERTQKLIDYIVSLLVIMFLFVLIYGGVRLTLMVNIQKSPVFGIPMSFFYSPVAWAALLMCIFTISSLIGKTLTKLKEHSKA